jgi:hypothetical protein
VLFDLNNYPLGSSDAPLVRQSLSEL